MKETKTKSWACTQSASGSDKPLDYLVQNAEKRRGNYPTQMTGYLQAKGSADAAMRVLGLDCEMVRTASGLALARVSLVSTDGALYDAFVCPEEEIIDYLTEHSGITEETLRDVTRSRAQALEELLACLTPSDILCGHDLVNDLHALGLYHERLIDTQLLYPHQDGPLYKSSLEKLAEEHLKRRIQLRGHSSVEDATASLELALLRVESRQGRLLWEEISEEEASCKEMPTRDVLLSRLRLHSDDVRCIYLRGSQAVGYAGSRDDESASDWDFVLVMRDNGVSQEDIHLSYGALDATIYDESTFARLLRDCTIWVLECIFAPPHCVLQQDIDYQELFAEYREKTPREIVHAKLRRSVSFESGRKWSKAKRLLTNNEKRSGRKGMFIALRFLAYGVEVARTGVIRELSGYNHLWDKLTQDTATTWSALRQSFEPIYQSLRAELHREAPKLARYAGPRRLLQATRVEQVVPSAKIIADTKPLQSAALATTRALQELHSDPNESLALLQRELHLQINQHASYPNVVQLRYTPRSPIDHPIVKECRGLLLDAARGFSVLAYPFDRFFDSNEHAVKTPLDWESARAFEKLDGSLAILYWYDGAWRVASSRRPDASGMMGTRDKKNELSFEALFWDIWRQEGYQPPPDGEHRCYLFELTSRRHPIVVRYPDERLTLIGARDLETSQEIDPAAISMGWRTLAPLFPETGEALRERVLYEASKLDAAMQEGFVVRDKDFRRLKIKSPDYLRMTWMFPLCPTKEKLGERHLLRVVISGESREFLLYCPEYRAELEAEALRYESLCVEIERAYQPLREIEEIADFARAAREFVFADVLFGMKKQRRSAHEVMQDLPIKRVERWLD